MSAFFDPVCYQLYFCGKGKEQCDTFMEEHLMNLFEEISPYIKRYAEISPAWSLNINVGAQGAWLTSQNVDESITRALDLFRAHEVNGQCNVFHLNKELPQALTISLRNNERIAMMNRIQLFSNRQTKKINPARVSRLLSCPSPDLRGILYPAKLFWFGFVDFSYFALPVAQPEADKAPQYYYHRLHIQLPRSLVELVRQDHQLQASWTRHLKELCDHYECSVGSINMDITSAHYQYGVMTRSYNNQDADHLGVGPRLTGYAWLMCLTQNQLESLGGVDQVASWQVFHRITPLQSGGVMLQLTDRVEWVDHHINSRMIEQLKPYLNIQESSPMDDLPISLRMSLYPEDVRVLWETKYSLRMPC